MKTTVENTPELHDALFHAICLLDHVNPQTDADPRDVAAARELRKLSDSLNQLLAAAGKGAISADRRGPRRQCSVAATGHRLRWNWFQKEKILTDRQ